jgi:hypothetical protein
MLHLLVFHAYINEIDGSRSKIPSKKSSQCCAEGFNSGVNGLTVLLRFIKFYCLFSILDCNKHGNSKGATVRISANG